MPKKLSQLEEVSSRREEFWCLYTQERLSFAWVVGYNLLFLLPMLVFFFLWLFGLKHDSDLQTAAVPFSMLVGLLAIFWSVFLMNSGFGDR
jgi:hypothetical protein